MKASVEPAVSNLRTYVTPQERSAVLWILGANFSDQIWTDPTGRIVSEAAFYAPFTYSFSYGPIFSGPVGSRFYMLSGITDYLHPQIAAEIQREPYSQVYSDGDVIIYMR